MAPTWLARPAVLRYLGLFGSVCCAIDAFLFGAPTYVRPDVKIETVLRLPHGPLILLLWTVGLAALCAAWWYGRRLTGTGLLTPRWVLVTAALWIVPMLLIPPLASRDMYAYACQGALYDAGFNPYVHAVADQPCPWLESVSVRWRTTPTPYGPLFIMLTGVAAQLGSQAAALVAFRVLAVLAVVLLAGCLPVLARRMDVPVDRALWLVLCCPIVAVHLVGGGHNDALTLAFLVAGLALLARPAPGRAALVAGSVLLGLSIAVKTTLGVVLPFAALLAVGGPAVFGAAVFDGSGRRLRPGGLALLARRGGVVLGVSLGTMVALSFASGLGLGWITALSGAGESVSWSSPPTAVGIVVDEAGQWFGASLNAVPVARAVALAILPVALAAILWHSRNRDPVYGAGLACLAVIFLAPITQPWYLLWPLVLISSTPAHARWLAGTVALSMLTILPDGTGALKPIQVPLSVGMCVLLGVVGARFVAWLRGVEPGGLSTTRAEPRPVVEPVPPPR